MKNNDKILILLITMLAVVSVTLMAFLIIKKDSIDPESDLILQLHNYFNSEKNENCEGLFNYSNKIVDYNDIEEKSRLCFAYQKTELKDIELSTIKVDKKKDICTIKKGIIFKSNENGKECSYTKIKRELIDNSYKMLFGKNVENNESFKIDNKTICYLNDDYYYCGLSETFTYTFGGESFIYRVIEKAVEKSSNIVIYDYFLRINDGTCYKNYTTSELNEKCNENYTSKTNINFKYMKKYGTKYKHVYKENEDGTYHWVSTEPIK